MPQYLGFVFLTNEIAGIIHASQRLYLHNFLIGDRQRSLQQESAGLLGLTSTGCLPRLPLKDFPTEFGNLAY